MTTPALVDKLDTDMVNGPRDDNLDWDAIWWRPVEDNVRRLGHVPWSGVRAVACPRVALW
ncbi:hypothetical protein GBO22_23790 [Mycobacterium avium subsp. hominissuis]|nr:hypothetical protein [Mycobacterium avium subsp. hominissuis]